MKKIKVKMNKPVYLDLPILEISKTLMYKFWYVYINPKYQNNAKLCSMDTDSCIIHIKTEDVYENIANDVEKHLIHQITKSVEHSLQVKTKKVIGLMNDELGGKIVTEFIPHRPKNYSYLMDDGNSDKKAEGTRKCVLKKNT